MQWTTCFFEDSIVASCNECLPPKKKEEEKTCELLMRGCLHVTAKENPKVFDGLLASGEAATWAEELLRLTQAAVL